MNVITWKNPLEIGRTYTEKDFPGIYYQENKEYHDKYCFKVLAESNEEAYIEDCKIMFPDENPLIFRKFDYFYLISMD